MARTPSGAKPKILIIGYTGGGKSTVASILARLTGGRAADTSHLLMIEFAKANGIHIADVIARKGEYRQRLFEFSNVRKATDPAYYVRTAIGDGANIVAGVRTKPELEAARKLVDRVVWVNRGTRGSTDELHPRHDFFILDTRDNEGPLWHTELVERCKRLIDRIMLDMMWRGKKCPES